MNESKVINDNARPNSYEFGKASNRHKIYYDKPEELKELLEALNAMGLIDSEAQ